LVAIYLIFISELDNAEGALLLANVGMVAGFVPEMIVGSNRFMDN
jgi:hypothetical protein